MQFLGTLEEVLEVVPLCYVGFDEGQVLMFDGWGIEIAVNDQGTDGEEEIGRCQTDT